MINTTLVLLLSGEIPHLRKATRNCCEFLLSPISGDTRLNQCGGQTWQRTADKEAQPCPSGLCHTSGPSSSSQHQKSVPPYPLGKHRPFFISLCFPFLRGGSPNTPILQQVTHCGRAWVVPPACLQGNGSFLWLLHRRQNSAHSRLG